MNFHCPMCHVVCQIIIIFWRFPSTERLFILFVHALTLIDGDNILHPNTNKPSNITNPSNTPQKKHQTKKPNTHAHSVLGGGKFVKKGGVKKRSWIPIFIMAWVVVAPMPKCFGLGYYPCMMARCWSFRRICSMRRRKLRGLLFFLVFFFG